MFSSVLHKRLPAESGINVVCVSPGIVHTNVVSFYSRKSHFLIAETRSRIYIFYCIFCRLVRSLGII